MCKVKSIFVLIFYAFLISLFLCACSEQFTTQSDNLNDTALNMNKRALRFEEALSLEDDSSYPQSNSGIAYFQKGNKGYLGFKMSLTNGSTFWLDNGSLIPPPETKPRKDVIITMSVEKDELNNELLYTFGPSGCTFDPPAEIYLSWRDMNAANANLYLIDDDGNRLENFPDDVDKIGQWMLLRIPHFSRYAVAYSD